MIKKKRQSVKPDLAVLTEIYENPPPDGVDVPLSLVSERDKVWDIHRSESQDIASIYSYNTDFLKYSNRIQDCSTYLDFTIDSEQGLKLNRSFFCKVRNCPVCQWRKSLYNKAMIYRWYEKHKLDYVKYNWLFLTLTIKNPHISDLRSTLKLMHNSWRKLEKRKEFKGVVGYIRATEVTRDKTNPYTHCHPHYHAILLVKPEYYKKYRVSHSEFVQVWSECLGVSYAPSVKIQKVYSKFDTDDGLISSVAELIKYACKPSDMIGDNTLNAHQWFFEYTKQVHKMRFIDSGGVLKGVLKNDKDITTQEMITSNSDEKTDNIKDKRLLSFNYYPSKRSYIYNPKGNT